MGFPLTCLLGQKTSHLTAPLKQDSQWRSGHFGAVVHGQTLELDYKMTFLLSAMMWWKQLTNLNAVGAESFHVTVVYKVDSVEIDNSQIGSGRFHFMDIDNFINFFFLFAYLLVCALTWKNDKVFSLCRETEFRIPSEPCLSCQTFWLLQWQGKYKV